MSMGGPAGGHLSLWRLEKAAMESIERSPFDETVSNEKNDGSQLQTPASWLPHGTGGSPERGDGLHPGASVSSVASPEYPMRQDHVQAFDGSVPTDPNGHITGAYAAETIANGLGVHQSSADQWINTASTNSGGPGSIRSMTTSCGSVATPGFAIRAGVAVPVSHVVETAGSTRAVANVGGVSSPRPNTGDAAGEWAGVGNSVAELSGIICHSMNNQGSVGGLSEAADAEVWKRLEEQLASLHRDVQDFATKRCPQSRNDLEADDIVMVHSDDKLVREVFTSANVWWEPAMREMLGKTYTVLHVPRLGIIQLPAPSEAWNDGSIDFPVDAVSLVKKGASDAPDSCFGGAASSAIGVRNGGLKNLTIGPATREREARYSQPHCGAGSPPVPPWGEAGAHTGAFHAQPQFLQEPAAVYSPELAPMQQRSFNAHSPRLSNGGYVQPVPLLAPWSSRGSSDPRVAPEAPAGADRRIQQPITPRMQLSPQQVALTPRGTPIAPRMQALGQTSHHFRGMAPPPLFVTSGPPAGAHMQSRSGNLSPTAPPPISARSQVAVAHGGPVRQYSGQVGSHGAPRGQVP